MTPADHARNFASRVAIILAPHTASGWNPSMPERVGSAILLGFVFVALPGWMFVLPALGLVTLAGAIVDMARRSLEGKSCPVSPHTQRAWG